MDEGRVARVRRVAGPVVEVRREAPMEMLELVLVGEQRLIGEVMRIRGDFAWVQVYEDTTGLTPGAPVWSRGEPLSVELGPGLVGGIFDGVQRPLDALRAHMGDFVSKGAHVPALDRARRWHFVPCLDAPCPVSAGATLGHLQETGIIVHSVMTPPNLSGDLLELAEEGDYTVDDPIGRLRSPGRETVLRLAQRWPVRVARPFAQRLPHTLPLVTGQRVIDTLFPVARGGVVVVPGGFGTGKTMVQHALAKWCDADLVVYIGCGERGNEMTEVLTDFPALTDPRTGRSLMERTILIANTSNMPVAARETSIYTGITMAEYYRDMGLHVAVMADSTSRWAEALRELSGRMEEMPADEGFPAYLPTRLAEFYERAGMVHTLAGADASISIIGAVSPPGGDFSEPVTQHTKRFVRVFWALDKPLANARHYPAISWMDSYSEYIEDVADWWMERTRNEWLELRTAIIAVMQQEARLQRVVKLVGADVLPGSQRLVLEVARLFKDAFLQQNAYDPQDAYCGADKQYRMLKAIVELSRHAAEAVKNGADPEAVRQAPIFGELMHMKFQYDNQATEALDALIERIEGAIHGLANHQ